MDLKEIMHQSIKTVQIMRQQLSLKSWVSIKIKVKSHFSSQRVNIMVIIHTNLGDIKIALNSEKAPETVKNFLEYVNSGHFEGTIFHRVIENFMIQGGGFDPDMNQKSVNAPIKCESNNGLSNKVGTVAMARTSDPHSATAQFFINTKDNDFLDFTAESTQGWGYCVFAEVVEGMAVVNQIKMVETSFASGMQDVPVENVMITKVTIEE